MKDEKTWQCYQEGYEAWNIYIAFGEEVPNPYKKGTKEWKEWNRGYNTNKDTVKEAEDYYSSDYM